MKKIVTILALLCLVTTLNAQVTTGTLNWDIEKSISHDWNGDYIFGVYFGLWNDTYTSKATFQFETYNMPVIGTEVNTGDYITHDNSKTTALITLLEEGAVIDASSAWVSFSGTIGEADTPNQPIIHNSSYTDLQGEEGYIGFQIIKDGNVHYAWLKAIIKNDGSVCEFVDWGVNETPDQGLKAGTTDVVVTAVDEDKLPFRYSLEQNYPNPFNPSTNIRYSLKEAGNVKLTVFNILGQQVAELVNGFKNAGNYSLDFNASNIHQEYTFTDLKPQVLFQLKKCS